MPIYDYQCEKCGDKFSINQKITDEPLNKCINLLDGEFCGGKLVRLIGNVGVVYKCGGFYSTDNPGK